MTTVSVLIPTFRRPDSFVRAVRSAFAQRGVDSFEIIAIDNSPEGSALDTFRNLKPRPTRDAIPLGARAEARRRDTRNAP
ncbi:MAG: glycosyltransferase [Caulobacteraceae bacterium]|nr:glycosyltransferase [Caulobacteraceae bacterium]